MILNTSDGKEIYYQTYGEKGNPAVILIHGIGADHNMFGPQVETFAKEGYFLIALDMRGHGESSKVTLLELEDWVRDLKELMEQEKIEKSVLIGVSMGGVIVQKFITQYPEKVEKIVICDSFGELKTFTEKALGFGQVFGFKLFHYLPRKMTAKLIASTYKNLSKEAQEYFEKVSLQVDYKQLVLARKAINKIDLLSELEKVEIPSLVLVGDRVDLMVRANRKIAEKLQNSSLKVLKGSLDPSNLVATEGFNQEVLTFLAKK